jgi:uncharacterized membrane protein
VCVLGFAKTMKLVKNHDVPFFFSFLFLKLVSMTWVGLRISSHVGCLPTMLNLYSHYNMLGEWPTWILNLRQTFFTMHPQVLVGYETHKCKMISKFIWCLLLYNLWSLCEYISHSLSRWKLPYISRIANDHIHPLTCIGYVLNPYCTYNGWCLFEHIVQSLSKTLILLVSILRSTLDQVYTIQIRVSV